LALIGFVRTCEIGVDVERIRPASDLRKLANRYFSLRERNELGRLPGNKLPAAFFRCWTRKEASRREEKGSPCHCTNLMYQ